MEFAVVLSMIVVVLYLYGFYEAALSLPDIPTGFHMGRNLNIARLEHNGSAAASVAHKMNDEESFPDQHQQQRNEKAPSPLAGHIAIPEGVWPVSVRDEVDDYEEILHVGDMKTVMKVPKFWAPPLHNKQFFTREQAMKVGTCIEPDPVTGSYSRGDKCPPDQRTIFIGLASYRDYQCRYTLESAFLRAAHPERIRIAVVDQIVVGEDAKCNDPIEPCDKNPEQALCKYKDQVDVYTMDAPLSVGPVFARHLGYRLYRGEYYATQSDAHVSFTTNWDSDIIEQIEATNNEMAVLSTYLTDVQGSIDEKTGKSLRRTRPIMCNTYYVSIAMDDHGTICLAVFSNL